MEMIVNNPVFMIALTFLAYGAGAWIQKKTHWALANPLLIGIILVIGVVLSGAISLESYDQNTQLINMILGPATMCLGIVVYRQKKLLKKHWKAILIGTFVGCVTSIVSVIVMSKFLGVEDVLMVSLIPKSVTTPIAMDVSETLQGIVPITVAVVIITGILGSVFGETIIKLLKSKNAIANGVAYGTAAHALGSAKAVESGEVEGAMASIALIASSMITVLLVLLFQLF